VSKHCQQWPATPITTTISENMEQHKTTKKINAFQKIIEIICTDDEQWGSNCGKIGKCFCLTDTHTKQLDIFLIEMWVEYNCLVKY
jgi:hypothetical protein